MGPRHVDIGIVATLVATPGTDPAMVREAAHSRLHEELVIVAPQPGDKVWPFGRDVTPLAVKGWLRKVEGVARVVTVTLSQAGRDTAGDPVRLGSIGLPRLRLAPDDITVERWPAGVRR